MIGDLSDVRHYFVALLPEPFHTLFTRLRVLGDPATAADFGRLPAHMTVRGPVPGKPTLSTIPFPAPIPVTLDAWDHWASAAGRSTIVMRLSAPELRPYWFKPDYPEGVPHLTLYDGPQDAYVDRLWDFYRHRPLPSLRVFAVDALVAWIPHTVCSGSPVLSPMRAIPPIPQWAESARFALMHRLLQGL
ncbi:MAG: hypothetical protein C7B46_15460 [Sulfobacillus benefaciens]|uniref:2'-5' RNA ligase n=1 Tax=Sulfobacillus benefaciens TaxID=453960 RepID=A0A2T2XCG3_9FIRM|nr:MAG: hypothetical protein C7B46_15460 [Sulfobacillus benefaciens]